MKAMDLPQFISLNGPQIGRGFLGMKYASFGVQNPGQPPENVSPPAGVNADRMARRKVMFDAFEGGLKTNVPTDAVQAHKEVYKKAMYLVVCTRKEVFALDKEPTPLKEEYGQPRVRSVRACWPGSWLKPAWPASKSSMGGWDNHQGIFPTLNNGCPNSTRVWPP